MTIGTLAPTVFETFYGVGYNRGLMKLELGGDLYDLMLNDAYEYNGTDPSLIFTGNRVNNPTIPDNYAVLVPVPEPETLVMLASALLLVPLFIRWKCRFEPVQRLAVMPQCTPSEIARGEQHLVVSRRSIRDAR